MVKTWNAGTAETSGGVVMRAIGSSFSADLRPGRTDLSGRSLRCWSHCTRGHLEDSSRTHDSGARGRPPAGPPVVRHRPGEGEGSGAGPVHRAPVSVW